MTYYSAFDHDTYGEAGELIRDFLQDNTRPKTRRIETNSTFGLQSTEEDIDARFVRLRGSDLLIPRRAVFVAFGGRLEYDLLFIVGFDGTRSPLHDVRYIQRPERSAKPVASSRIRNVPLDALVREAISSKRVVYRRIAPDAIRWVSDEEKEAVNDVAGRATRYTARSSATGGQLQLVAEEYRMAIARGEYPTKRVQTALNLPSRDVAAKWVQKARAANLLPPAPGERKSGFKK